MADDVVLNPGAGGDTIAADDVGGVKYQVVKLAVGADGAASLVANANPIPVSDAGGALTVDNGGTFAVQAAQSGTWNVTNVSGTVSLPTGAATAAKQPALGTAGTASADVISVQGIASMTALQVADNGGSLTVDAPVGTPAFVRLSDGTNPIATLPVSLASVPSHAVTNAGTFAVQVSSLPALAAGSNAIGTVTAVGAAAEDAAASGNPVLVGGRYDSSPRTLETGDAGAIALNASGQVLVEIAAGAGSGGTAAADDADFTAGTTSGTPVMGVYESTPTTVTDGDMGMVGITSGRAMKVAVTSGGISGVSEDAVASGSAEGVLGIVVRDDALSSLTPADGDYTVQRTNARGATWVCLDSTAAQNVTVAAALPAGTNNIGDVDVLTLPNVTLAAGTNTNEVVGDAAHGAAVSGNPLLTGLEGRSTAPTAVDDGDVVRALATLLGKQVVLPYALPANTQTYASSAAVTDTADDEVFAAVASTRHYITGIQVFNGHATTSTEVVIKDGSTVKWRGWAQAAGGGASVKFDPPIRGTANTAVNVANITNSSSTYFNLQGYQAAE